MIKKVENFRKILEICIKTQYEEIWGFDPAKFIAFAVIAIKDIGSDSSTHNANGALYLIRK